MQGLHVTSRLGYRPALSFSADRTGCRPAAALIERPAVPGGMTIDHNRLFAR